MNPPEGTVIVDAVCRDSACQRFGQCREGFKLAMTEERVKHAVAQGVSREGPGRIFLDCCPRYGKSNPLCFTLKTVNGAMVKSYQDLVERQVKQVTKEIEKAQEKHRLIIGKLHHQLNFLREQLDIGYTERMENAD